MDNLNLQNIIESKIFVIRGRRVMLDKDIAILYSIPTKALMQAVKRNRKRFPNDFILILTLQEVRNLRSQIVTSSWGGTRHNTYAFTEQGIAMLSSILKSEKAIQVNIAIMRVFVKLRQIISANKELARRLNELEGKIEKHDVEIQAIFDAIRRLMAPTPEKPKPKIGFHP